MMPLFHLVWRGVDGALPQSIARLGQAAQGLMASSRVDFDALQPLHA